MVKVTLLKILLSRQGESSSEIDVKLTLYLTKQMQKLPTFDSAKHEFTYFATVTMKNAMAVQAIENRLNIMSEAINELIDELADKDSNVDLEAFKTTFLKELATLLNQNSEFEFSNSLFDLLGTERTNLKEAFKLLEAHFQTLAEKVSKIESALGHEKVKVGAKHMKIVLVDGLNRDYVADVLVAENVHPSFGEFIVKQLNQNAKEDSYFVLKPDDYRLSRGMEDLA